MNHLCEINLGHGNGRSFKLDPAKVSSNPPPSSDSTIETEEKSILTCLKEREKKTRVSLAREKTL